MAEPQIVRKSAFASLRGVTPGRVSQWIAEGKIHGPAIVGEGRSAMIDASVAVAQLRNSLDVNQRFGLNGVGTRLDLPPAASPAAAPIVDTVEAQIKAEKLRQAQLTTSRLEEEDRSRRGLYIDAAASRAEIARVAAELLKAFEGALPDFAAALAGKFQIPSRDALHLMRAEFRRFRERHAEAHGRAAAAEPETIAAADPEPNGIQ